MRTTTTLEEFQKAEASALAAYRALVGPEGVVPRTPDAEPERRASVALTRYNAAVASRVAYEIGLA